VHAYKKNGCKNAITVTVTVYRRRLRICRAIHPCRDVLGSVAALNDDGMAYKDSPSKNFYGYALTENSSIGDA
jgi:hypothetical protein